MTDPLQQLFHMVNENEIPVRMADESFNDDLIDDDISGTNNIIRY